MRKLFAFVRHGACLISTQNFPVAGSALAITAVAIGSMMLPFARAKSLVGRYQGPLQDSHRGTEAPPWPFSALTDFAGKRARQLTQCVSVLRAK